MRKFIYKLYVRLNTSIFAYKMSSGLKKLAYILGIKFIAWLAVFSLAAGISPGVVAGDVEDCKNYYLAEDYNRAFPACSRAAEQGDTAAQFRLGWMYDNGAGAPENDREAAKWYRLAAEQGEASAQNNLGWMYANGYGVPENDREAAKWYKLAAEQGMAQAQFNLGWMYDKGEGVPKNDREAVKWYKLAAEQGYANAQSNLGRMYVNGYGVPKNDREAVKWIRLAAEQGFATPQYNLGVMYDNGYGVPENDREAVKWYRLAAEQGFADAQYNLGVMYGNGEGVIQDYQEAYIWYSLAAANGHKDASKWRDEAAQFLTVSELRTARQEAKKRLQKIESRQSEQPANDSPPITNIAPRVATAPDIPINAAAVAFENGWRSVVVVETDESQGSGVIIRPNIVATNCHVVDDGTAIIVFKANNRRAQKDEVFRAQIHRAHEARDLCLLEVSGLWGIPANLRRTDSLTVGESVYAIGAPQGLDYSLSAGVISQLRKEEGESIPLIQTDAAISPGSSGGGLFDAQGNLVGITQSKIVDDSAEGIGFAIPADWILQAEQ